MSKRTVLVIEDHKTARDTLLHVIPGWGYNAVGAADSEAGMRILADRDVDVVITDLRLPGADGMEVLERIRLVDSAIPVILMTAFGSDEVVVNAIKQGAEDYLSKPLDLDRVRAVLERAMRTRELKLRNVDLEQRLQVRNAIDAIVGQSRVILSVKETIAQVAPTSASVLIEGESGTGKEIVANALHSASNRSEKPFLKVAVAALPRDLLETELFGHERGAFTGAHRRRKGRFELADGGTLFLDEISELPGDLQVKLLRVLENGEFERIGGTETLKVDVRLIAATNKDLFEQVRLGSFRDDLYYRLNVLDIKLPPLRSHKEDVPLLVQHFLLMFAREGAPPRELTPATMRALIAYDWPGNVRELRNVVERASIIAPPDRPIMPEYLPEQIRSRVPAVQAGTAGSTGSDAAQQVLSTPANAPVIPAGTTMKEVEREAVRVALVAEQGNKTRAAKSLGIGLKTLYRKIEQYDLQKYASRTALSEMEPQE